MVVLAGNWKNKLATPRVARRLTWFRSHCSRRFAGLPEREIFNAKIKTCDAVSFCLPSASFHSIITGSAATAVVTAAVMPITSPPASAKQLAGSFPVFQIECACSCVFDDLRQRPLMPCRPRQLQVESWFSKLESC